MNEESTSMINSLRVRLANLEANQNVGLPFNTFQDHYGSGYIPESSTSIPQRWNVSKTGSLQLTIKTGDVEFGGQVGDGSGPPLIAWADMTLDASVDSAGIVTIPASSTTWAVWLEIDLRHPNEAVTVRSDTEVEALSADSTDSRWFGHMLQKRIATATIEDDVITAVVGDYQCGNVFVPRAS